MSKLRCEVRDWHTPLDLHAGVAVAKVMGRVESQSRRLTPAAHGHAENLSRGSREDAPLRSSIVGRAGLQHVFHEPFRHRHLLSPQRRSRFSTCLPSRTQRRKRRSKARAHSLANGGSCVSSTPLAPRRQVPRRLARGRRRLRQVGLSQFLNCERRPATATVPQPRHHIATIAKVISGNETNEGPGFFLLRDEPGANRYPPMTPASPDRSRLPGLGTGDSGGR
jgi:hypothetical protein